MGTPQPGIFALGTRAHRHLEYRLDGGLEPDAMRGVLNDLFQSSVTVGGANVVLGFGPDVWRRLHPGALPSQLAGFPSVPGVPSTQADVWVWAHGTGDDVLRDVTHALHGCLDQVAQLTLELSGFVYQESRDLTGFIDGTENPVGLEAFEVAVVPEGEAGAGGSYAMTQRWVHDLDRFGELSVDEQEDVIGRTKADSVELVDEVRPATAHISRVVIEEDGQELEILRRSVPYAGVTEEGLHFVAFSAEPSTFEKMLRRMFEADDEATHDHLTDFSTPVTGSAWFVPSLEELDEVLGTSGHP
jgi:putative iron-dependent peroxidase